MVFREDSRAVAAQVVLAIGVVCREWRAGTGHCGRNLVLSARSSSKIANDNHFRWPSTVITMTVRPA